MPPFSRSPCFRRVTTRRSGSAHRPDEVLAEDYRLVVLGVLRPVEQRDVALLRGLHQRAPRLRPGVEFGGVPAAELLPPLRVVAEPAAQLVAGGDILEPAVEPEPLLVHPARPQPVDEEPAPGRFA